MAAESQFQLYRLLIEEVREARRARRELSNAFLTLNLAGVGALGFLVKDGQAARLPDVLLIWCAVALIVTCWIWRTSNKYYTRMLNAKYEILYKVEDGLESDLGSKPIRNEWEALKPKKPNRAFSLEYAMPALFILGYVMFLAYRVDWASAIQCAQALWTHVMAATPG